MSQAQNTDFNIDPYSTSGVELTNKMNRLHSAHISAHSGPTRPPYAVIGTIWLDNTTPPGQLVWFDGTNDQQLGAGAIGGAISKYDPTKNYAVGDIAINAARIYKNVTAVTTPEPFDPSKWQQIDSGGVVAAITAFSTSKTYQLNDMVTNNGMLYVANKVIGVAGAFNPTDWDQIAPGTGSTGAITLFDATKTYALNDLIVYNGKIYKNVAAITVPSPFRTSDWTEIDIGGLVQVVKPHSTTDTYAIDDLVGLNGKIYRANQPVPAEPFDPVKWDQIAPSVTATAAISRWDPSKTYVQNDLVIDNGKIYRAKAAVPATTVFDPTKWTEVGSQVSQAITTFSPTLPYVSGQLVVNSSKIYRALAAVAPGPFDPTEWTEIDIGSAETPGVRIHDQTLSYSAGDIVAHSGHLYSAKAAIAPKVFSATDWNQIDSDGVNMPITFYNPTKTYVAGNLVVQGGNIYKANTTVTGAFDPTKWTQVDSTRIRQAITPFDPTKTYSQNDLVVDSGYIYRALHATGPGARVVADWDQLDSGIAGTLRTTAPTAADGDDFDVIYVQANPATKTAGDGFYAKLSTGWQPIDISRILPPPTNVIQAWNPASVYSQNDLAYNGGKIYRANAAIPASPTFDPTKWTEIGAQQAQAITAFSTSVAYTKDQLVVQGGKIYSANNNNGPGAFTATDWSEIDVGGETPRAITIHDVNKTYSAGDLVTYLGDIYRAKGAVAAGAFQTVDWKKVSASGLTWSVITAPTTAVDGNGYMVDTTGGAVDQPLPTGVSGIKIGFKDYAQNFGTNNLTITPAAGELIEGQAAPLVIDNQGWSGILEYADATKGWLLLQSSPALSGSGGGGGGGTPHPINKFDPAVGYAQDDLVIEAGEIYRAKAAVAAGAFDPTQWDKSVGGMNFAVLPSNDVGIEDDLISVAAASALTDYTFRSATPAKDSARSWGAMYGLVNDLGGGNYVVLRAGPTVQMYIASQATSPYPVGTLVSWDVDKFTWTAPIEVRHAKGAVPANFSGTPAEWDQLIDDLATDPPPLSHIDVYVGGVIRPTVQLYTKHNGSWENRSIGVGGEVDSIADSIAIRSAAGGIAAKGLSFFDGKDPIINYIDQAKHMRALSIGKNALKQVVGGTLPDRAGMDIVAIGEEAAGRVNNTALSDAKQGNSVVIGNYAAWFSTDIGFSAFVGHQAGAHAKQSERSSFFGWHGAFKSTRTTMNDCTAIGYHALVPAGADGTLDKCTALGASAGAPPSSGNAAMEPTEKTLCAGSSNVTLLGYGAKPTGNMTTPTKNEFVLGDTNVAKLRCKVTSITALSDERDKKDIADLGLGLDFINGLRPVSFEWDERGEDGYKGVKAVGFIAQEVLKAEKDSGMYDYLGMVSEDDPEKLEMRTGELIPILTKAVQELSAQVEELKKELNDIKKSA